MGNTQVTIGGDRVLHVNGKRFFPIAARHIPQDAPLALLKEVGFNAVRWPVFGLDLPGMERIHIPENFGGLMFFPYLFNRGDLSEEKDVRKRDLVDMVQRVREHPDLLCYEQRNEPAFTFGNAARPASPPEGMLEGSAVIRELDPDHPIRVGHMTCNLISTLAKYNPAVDMVGCNSYVVMPHRLRRFVGFRPDGLFVDCPNQTLSAVGELTTKMMRVGQGRPVWMQLQAMSNENWYSEIHVPEYRGHGVYEYNKLYPNRWQMRFMAFNAIIRGATALSWAMYRTSVNESAWQDIRAVIGELSRLHNVLAAPTWKGSLAIEYQELGFGDWTGVEVLVKEHDGRIWILAVNTQFDPMEAVFSSLPKQFGSKAEVYNEHRHIHVSDGRFSDRFQPYEVHIYRSGVSADKSREAEDDTG